MADLKWDPQKEALNIEKRNLDFATASQIWDGSIVEKVDERRDYGETRHHRYRRVRRKRPRSRIHMARRSSPNYLGQEGKLS